MSQYHLEDKTIIIGVTRRLWEGNVAFATLVFHTQTCEFRVRYDQWTHRGVWKTVVGPFQTKNWLWQFVRPQAQLPDDAHKIQEIARCWTEPLRALVERTRQ